MNIKLSIIIVTKNAEKYLDKCLFYINQQSYPKNLIETLILDGGSVDQTRFIAEKHEAKFIEGGYSDNQEARRLIGVNKSTGEIIAFIDADNYMENKDWISEMMQPFNNNIVGCSFTKWYGLSANISYTDNYYALLGGNDPVAYYLGKHDRVAFGNKILPYGAILQKTEKNIEFVSFNKDKLPTLGSNGFLIRKKLITAACISDPEKFYHIDIHVDILSSNPEIQYAIVENNIVHETGGTIINNTIKRVKYKLIHHDKLNHKRRYAVFNKNDIFEIIKLIYIIFIAITLIEPMFRSLLGYYRTRRFEWFIHPFATLMMVLGYSFSVILYKMKR